MSIRSVHSATSQALRTSPRVSQEHLANIGNESPLHLTETEIQALKRAFDVDHLHITPGDTIKFENTSRALQHTVSEGLQTVANPLTNPTSFMRGVQDAIEFVASGSQGMRNRIDENRGKPTFDREADDLRKRLATFSTGAGIKVKDYSTPFQRNASLRNQQQEVQRQASAESVQAQTPFLIPLADPTLATRKIEILTNDILAARKLFQRAGINVSEALLNRLAIPPRLDRNGSTPSFHTVTEGSSRFVYAPSRSVETGGNLNAFGQPIP